MSTDLTISLGLDDAQLVRSLQRSGAYAKRQAWQIARDFERAEMARERATRESMRRIQRIHRVATVAIVAGAGAIGKALQKAAEVDPNVANDLSVLRREVDGLMTALGRDLGESGLLKFLSKTVELASKARELLGDGLAVVLNGGDLGDIREQREVRAAQEARDAEARRAMSAAEIANGLGSADPAEQRKLEEQRRRRDLNTAIKDADLDPARAAELRERLDRVIEEENAAERREAAGQAENERRNRAAARMRLGADIAAARAERSDDPAVARDARFQQYRADAAELEARIYNDQTIPAAEKHAAVMREHELLREQYISDLHAIEKAVEREARITEEQMAIDLARAEGREKEARTLETLIRYEHEAERIRAMAGINEERRQRLLEQAGRIRDAELAGPRRSQDNLAFAPGLAGGDTLRRQLGTASNGPAEKTANNTAEAVKLLREIRDQKNVAVVG